MGVIYSSLEVRDNKIPQDGDHIRAAELVRDGISDIGGVVMTLVHGSVPEGRFNLRSDLDVLINFSTDKPTDRPEKIDDIRLHLDAISDATAVKIEANIWPQDDPTAAIEERMYDLLFSWHLVQSMTDTKWCLGKVDERIISIATRTFRPSDVRRVAMNYVVYKSDGFVKAPYLFNEHDPRCLAAMQRGLELPKAAGRKVAQLKATTEGKKLDANEIASLASVKDDLDEPTNTALEELLRIDREYTSLLTDTRRDHEQSRIEYLTWLDAYYRVVMHAGINATSGFITFVDQFGRND